MSPFNKEAWAGTKPLVAPLKLTVAEGAVVWEKGRDEPGDSERFGGLVVARKIDHDTGELESVTFVKASKRSGRFTVSSHEMRAGDIDPTTIQPPSSSRLHRVAREIFRYLGDRPAGYITGFDRWLMNVAGGLVGLDDEMRAADKAARDEYHAAKEAS